MRVSFISTILGCPWGGADTLWTQAAEAARADGHEVLIAASAAVAGHPRMLALRAAGAQFHLRRGFTLFNGRRARIRQAALRRLRHPASLPAALDRFAPDYVFICQGGAYDFLLEHGLVAWLEERRCPFALVCQSNAEGEVLSPEARAAAAGIIARSNAFVFVSTHNRDLAERQVGRPMPQARLVQNPVELPDGPVLPWPEADPARLAVVARIDAVSKGLDILIDALAYSLGEIDGWELNLFGRGPDEAALTAQAAARGLGGRVRFEGFQSDIRTVWERHHLLLLPSRREGCSLAMLEALACGRPVVATAVGGVGDWVEDGVNGFIDSGRDAESFARTLRAAWRQRHRWAAMGEAAGRRLAAQRDPHPGRTLLSLIA